MTSADRAFAWMTWALPVVLLTAYGAWMLAVWPGVLGPDSYAILKEVTTDGG